MSDKLDRILTETYELLDSHIPEGSLHPTGGYIKLPVDAWNTILAEIERLRAERDLTLLCHEAAQQKLAAAECLFNEIYQWAMDGRAGKRHCDLRELHAMIDDNRRAIWRKQ